MENLNEISHSDGFFQLNLSIKLNPEHGQFTPHIKRNDKNNGRIGQRKAGTDAMNAEAESSQRDVKSASATTLMHQFQDHKDNSDFFQMTRSPKGKVIVINNDRFHNVEKTRKGSEEDVKSLEHVFRSLQGKTTAVDVTVVRNISARQVLGHLELFVDFQDPPSFVAVVLMSHGTCRRSDGRLIDMICGNDNTPIDVKKVIKLFDRDDLEEIPVLMFFQMCRGDKQDRADLRDVEDSNENDAIPLVEDSANNIHSCAEDFQKYLRDLLSNVLPGVKFITPGEEDEDENDEPARDHVRGTKNMLVSFSTVEGHVSKRNRVSGTWFIQTLCEMLKKNADKKEIIEIMEDIHRIVHEKGGLGIACDTGHTLKKKLYFYPGLPNGN